MGNLLVSLEVRIVSSKDWNTTGRGGMGATANAWYTVVRRVVVFRPQYKCDN